MTTARLYPSLALAALVLASAGPASAGSATAPALAAPTAVPAAATDPATQKKLDELDQKVKVLERLREIDKEAADAKKATAVTVTANPKDGFSIKDADGSFVLKLGGYVQGDLRAFIGDDVAKLPTQFLVRRARIDTRATAFKIIDFRLMTDFGSGTATVQDAYAEARFLPELKLLAGKTKSPVGLERLQSGTALLFVERGLPTNLVPNRDVGVQLGGDFWDGALTYQAGVWNGVPDGGSGDVDTFDDKDFVVRVFSQPFKASDADYLSGLGIGISASFGSQHSTPAAPALPSYRSGGQNVFFRYKTDASATAVATEAGTARADGSRTRYSPQLYWYWGGFGLLGEYVVSSQEVRKDTKFAELSNSSYQVAASYLLTDDVASYKGVNPKGPFDPAQGNWGAFELKARWNELDVDDDAFSDFADPAKSASKASAWALGVNWYLNRNYKINFDYEQTSFDGGAKNADRETEKAFLTRFQVAI